MLKSERTKFIIDFLEQTYPNTPVPLNNKNVFELLVAVLLSAQCTDERVNKVTPSLFKIADNPFDMEKSLLKKFMKLLDPVGLHLKNLKQFLIFLKFSLINLMGLCPRI